MSYRGRIWKLTHTEVGRLRVDDVRRDWPLSAAELAHRHRASWALCIEAGALESAMDRFGERARRGEGLDAQLLMLTSLAREELIAGRLDLYPFRLRGLPVPSPAVVKASVDSVCPVGRTALFGLFERGELWTSIAIRRGPRGFDLILGPDEVRPDMGLLSADWRRDFRHLARAIEERAGPLALGCYAEVNTLRRLVVDPTPGAWARAAAVRDVILSPMPAPLAAALGLDASRAAYAAVRSIAERFDPVGVVAPSFEVLRQVAGAMMGHVTDVAGQGRGSDEAAAWKPLEILRRMLTREH